MSAAFDWQQVFSPFLQHLKGAGLAAWQAQLRQQLHERFEVREHGDLARWQQALSALPACPDARLITQQDVVRLVSGTLAEAQQAGLETALRGLMPWRKGPFDFFGVAIDTEWRSDWKWQRILPHISSLAGRWILDVGCGSGYHLWRMLGAGAQRVTGIDPSLLFLMQFLVVKHYAGTVAADLLPLRLEDLPPQLGCFDSVFSMGVLYHRRSPLDHLQALHEALRKGGELILETLVVPGDAQQCLMPEDRYAMMRNVWFIPSVPMLERWLRRSGFTAVRCVDVNQTSCDEQRSTDWMRFQSLQDFLDPQNPQRTIEGYPAPLRATLVASKPA